MNQYDTHVDGVSDQGTHSNFTAQQIAPKGTYDTLTEADIGTTPQSYHPTNYVLDGSSTLVSGSPSNLVSDDGSYMTFGSYVSSTSSQTLYSNQRNNHHLGRKLLQFLHFWRRFLWGNAERLHVKFKRSVGQSGL